MADVSVPSIATATPDGDDTVLGVKDGIVKRFSLDNVGAGINFSAVNATTNMVFNTNGTEKMRLDSSGNLGVGTNSPATKLEVQSIPVAINQSAVSARFGAANDLYSLSIINNINGVGSASTEIKGPTSSFALLNLSVGAPNQTSAMTFATDGAEKMRLDNAGNLGIGTSSPSTKLEVSTNTGTETLKVTQLDTTGATQATVRLSHGSGTQATYSVGDGYAVTGTTTSAPFVFTTNNTERVRIDSSGNLGIGTTSPAYKLSVSGDVAVLSQNTLRLQNSDNTNAYALQNAGASGGGNAYLSFVQTGVAERMRIDSAGNLGLGVTPSAWGNGVSAQGSGWALSTTGGFDSLALTANARQTAYGNGGQNFVYRGTAACSSYEQANGNHIWRYAASGTAGDAVSFTQAMTLANSGHLALGTTSTAYRLTVNYTAPSSFTNAASDFVQMWQAGGTNALGVALSTGDTYARFVTNAGYKFAWNSASTQIMTLSEGGALATVGTMDATSFRDASDTAYYLDPANTGTSLNVAGAVIQGVSTTAATLTTNSTLTFSIVDNSTLRISVRGSDGTTRTATVALT